jgi:hypothetical protein
MLLDHVYHSKLFNRAYNASIRLIEAVQMTDTF